MDIEQIKNGLAIIAAGYAKRWMEGNVYDRAFATELGKGLSEMGAPAKYSIEAVLMLLSAFFEQKLIDDTPTKKFVKEIGMDAAPEISKRLINHAKTAEEKHVVNALLTLDREILIQLLDYLYSLEQEQRREVLSRVGGFSAVELSNLANLDQTGIAKVFSLNKSESVEPFSVEIIQKIDHTTQGLRELRMKLRARRTKRNRDE